MPIVQHVSCALYKLAQRMYFVAGVAIVAMMLITCADVLLRLFRRPIPGTYEVVCYLAAVAVSFAMAHTLVNKGHVAVNLVSRLLPPRLQLSLGFVHRVLSFILFSILSWQSVIFALDLIKTNEVSLTLEIPYYPFILGMAFSSAAVALVLLNEIFNIILHGEQ